LSSKVKTWQNNCFCFALKSYRHGDERKFLQVGDARTPEEMMQENYRSVCSLAYITGLVNQVVTLLWDHLANNTKDGTFTRVLKYIGSTYIGLL